MSAKDTRRATPTRNGLVTTRPVRSVTHDTFSVEREFNAPVSLVYGAWASQEAKARWFLTLPPGWAHREYALDFREGGRESFSIMPAGAPVHRVESTYQNIVRDARIIYTYSMWVGETHIVSTLATIEFHKATSGTRLVLTEQAALLDGFDTAPLRGGGTHLLNNLEAEITRLTSPRPV